MSANEILQLVMEEEGDDDGLIMYLHSKKRKSVKSMFKNRRREGTTNSIDSEEEVIIVSCLLAEEEEKEQKRAQKLSIWVHEINQKRQEYEEYHTLFPDLLNDDARLFKYFRMTNTKFVELLTILRPHIEKQNTTFRYPIYPQERLALCLRFLATGNSFRSLAFSYRLGDATVQEIVYSICHAIWNVLKPVVMPPPDEQRWISSEQGFRERWNFPNAVAALDGKHVKIQAPPNSRSNLFCYKKHFSTVLLALVDFNYKFLLIDVGAYEKNSDAAIFRTSSVGKGLADGSYNLPSPKVPPGGANVLPHVIVGDEAFPLCTYLMRPYSRDDVRQNEEKNIFNYRLNRARNTVENTFGILVRKFRTFERTLNVPHERAVIVTAAACCLHNFLRDDICYWSESDHHVSISNAKGLSSLKRSGGSSRQDALDVRECFKQYFNSSAGSIEWQQKRVRAGQRHS